MRRVWTHCGARRMTVLVMPPNPRTVMVTTRAIHQCRVVNCKPKTGAGVFFVGDATLSRLACAFARQSSEQECNPTASKEGGGRHP